MIFNQPSLAPIRCHSDIAVCWNKILSRNLPGRQDPASQMPPSAGLQENVCCSSASACRTSPSYLGGSSGPGWREGNIMTRTWARTGSSHVWTPLHPYHHLLQQQHLLLLYLQLHLLIHHKSNSIFPRLSSFSQLMVWGRWKTLQCEDFDILVPVKPMYIWWL